MTILYIITQADGGGAQKYVLALAKHFNGMIAAGLRLRGRSDSRSDEAVKLFDDAKAARLQTFTLKHLKRNIHPWHDFWAVWEIRELVKNLKPDIVHLNSTKAGVLGSFACIDLRTKIVFTAHGFRFNEPLSLPAKNFYLTLEKIASSYRDFIITVSDADRKSALKNKLIDENKIQTIHNGLAPIDFLPREEARKALGLPLDKKITVTIANDYKTKGFDILEKALAIKPVSGTLTVVMGEVSNKKQSNENIKYLGFIQNASKYLKAFDATVISSRKEGFPFAALEAMQAGQPIIATNVGGIPEALGDAGKLVPPDDAKALGEAIETVFGDENRAKKLSLKALERAKLFTEEKMLEETKKIYSKLLA